MQWLNEPASWQRTGDVVTVNVDPATDFWRETGYGYIRDSGHIYGEFLPGDLDVSVRVRGVFAAQYDQAGVMLRVDGRIWLKTGIEFFEGRPRLSTVLTLGKSSWMVTDLPSGTDEVTLRVSRRGDAVEVRYIVADGPAELAALVFLPPGREVLAGIMCAAPEGPGFGVRFHDLMISDRDWDSGQQDSVPGGWDAGADGHDWTHTGTPQGDGSPHTTVEQGDWRDHGAGDGAWAGEALTAAPGDMWGADPGWQDGSAESGPGWRTDGGEAERSWPADGGEAAPQWHDDGVAAAGWRGAGDAAPEWPGDGGWQAGEDALGAPAWDAGPGDTGTPAWDAGQDSTRTPWATEAAASGHWHTEDDASEPDAWPAGAETSPAGGTEPAPPWRPAGPVEAEPVATSPVETSPVETSPVETSPVEASPVEASPVEAGPMEAGRIETSSGETGPAQYGAVQAGPGAAEDSAAGNAAEAADDGGTLDDGEPAGEPAWLGAGALATAGLPFADSGLAEEESPAPDTDADTGAGQETGESAWAAAEPDWPGISEPAWPPVPEASYLRASALWDGAAPEHDSAGLVSAERDSAELGGAELDGAELDGAGLDSAERDGAERDGAELDSAGRDRPEQASPGGDRAVVDGAGAAPAEQRDWFETRSAMARPVDPAPSLDTAADWDRLVASAKAKPWRADSADLSDRWPGPPLEAAAAARAAAAAAAAAEQPAAETSATATEDGDTDEATAPVALTATEPDSGRTSASDGNQDESTPEDAAEPAQASGQGIPRGDTSAANGDSNGAASASTLGPARRMTPVELAEPLDPADEWISLLTADD